MATKTSLVINALSDGKAIQKTLTDINPAADNAALKTFGQMLNALTTNTYVKTDRIDKTNCDAVVAKAQPQLSKSAADSLRRTACLNGIALPVDYTGDGELYIMNNDNTTWCTTFRSHAATGQLNLYIGVINSQTADAATAPHDIVIRSEETDNYAAGEWVFTIEEDE